MTTIDSERVATVCRVLGLEVEDIDRLTRLDPVLPFELFFHLSDNLTGEVGLLVARINKVLHEQIWAALLAESRAEPTTLGAYGVDRNFLVWSSVRVGSVTGPGLARTVLPLTRFLHAETTWAEFVGELNESLRPPRGTGDRQREKARNDTRRQERLAW